MSINSRIIGKGIERRSLDDWMFYAQRTGKHRDLVSYAAPNNSKQKAEKMMTQGLVLTQSSFISSSQPFASQLSLRMNFKSKNLDL